MANDFKVTFWGTQGSTPVGNPHKTRYGTNTPCVSVECGDNVMVFDMGTGYIPFSAYFLKKYKPPKTVHLFISHYHLDHIEGLPFAGLTYTPGVSIHFYGQPAEGMAPRAILSQIFSPPFCPISLIEDDKAGRFFFETVGHGHRVHFPGGIEVECFSVPHPGGSLSFKVSWGEKTFVYLSDYEYDGQVSPEFYRYLHGSDATAIDAYFSNANLIPGWGHSTWEQAVEVWQRAGVKKMILYHHHIASIDTELDALGQTLAEISGQLVIARDGMVLDL